jgi:hypothetical protein
MKATDFNLSQKIQFNFDTGMTIFESNRLVIFNTEAIGLLRKLVVEGLDWEKAREIFLQFGYQNGYADFLQLKVNYDFDNEMELLEAGPVIHTWEGIVKASPKELNFDREKGEFYFTGIWKNSYEADQHLSYFGEADEPVCWTLMGYASGWCTAFFGEKVIAIEPVCVGKGDEACEWEIKPEAEWGEKGKPYIEALKEF